MFLTHSSLQREPITSLLAIFGVTDDLELQQEPIELGQWNWIRDPNPTFDCSAAEVGVGWGVQVREVGEGRGGGPEPSEKTRTQQRPPSPNLHGAARRLEGTARQPSLARRRTRSYWREGGTEARPSLPQGPREVTPLGLSGRFRPFSMWQPAASKMMRQVQSI